MRRNIQIRPYNKTDKDTVVAVLELNVPMYFDPTEVPKFEHYLEHRLQEYFVVLCDNAIVGAGGIFFNQQKTEASMSWGFIHPDFQGLGIGKKLLAYRMDFIKNIPTIENIIVQTSQLVYGFYEKNGFVLQETKKDYWAEGLDLYHMIYIPK